MSCPFALTWKNACFAVTVRALTATVAVHGAFFIMLIKTPGRNITKDDRERSFSILKNRLLKIFQRVVQNGAKSPLDPL